MQTAMQTPMDTSVQTSVQKLSVAAFFDGHDWQQNVEVSWQDGHIVGITALETLPDDVPAAALASHDTELYHVEPRHAEPPHVVLPHGRLVPGFIDVQVNGGGGVLFNSTPDVASLRQMRDAHAAYGTTAMLPTVITDSVAIMQQCADAIAAAIAAQEPGIIGIHFEGPHLSLPKKGVHPAAHIRPITPDEWQIYARQDLGIKVITVAPEHVSTDDIARLVELGVHVCLGHSNADAAQVQAALAAGARGFTHLFNAMSALGSREPGMVGAALADRDSWCGIILDGHHVHPLSAQLALYAKPRGKIMLVTDAMAPVGTTQAEFAFFDGVVRRDGDKLTAASGALAGSVLDMAAAVRYAATTLAQPLAEALRMAALYPAEFLQCASHRGQLQRGCAADMVWLSDQGDVLQCWINGRAMLPAST